MKQKFFGIEFAEDFHLNYEKRRKLSFILFLNPNTYPDEAMKFIRISPLPEIMHLLRKSLLAEIEKSTQKDDDQMSIAKDFEVRFFNKLRHWIKAFGCPTFDELTEISRVYPIIGFAEIQEILQAIVGEEGSSLDIIIDYLKKYCSFLTYKEIDYFLDVYNCRKQLIKLLDGIQLKIAFKP